MNIENMSIGFIGAGRVGYTLGRYFFEKKLLLSGYYSRNAASSLDASVFTHSRAFDTMEELVACSDIIFITTPDERIYSIYSMLKQYDLRDKIICHCSGALSTQIFDNIDSLGACAYSVHPAFAVSDKYNSYKEFSKAFFTVEGSDEKIHIMRAMLDKLNNPYKIINSKDKAKYHTALVLSSNLVIALYHMASDLLCECGFDVSSATDVLNPLFLNNAKSLTDKGCEKALTGPVDRNDISTVIKHLSVMDNNKMSAVYKTLSAELIKIAGAKYPNRDYSKMEELLGKEDF